MHMTMYKRFKNKVQKERDREKSIKVKQIEGRKLTPPEELQEKDELDKYLKSKYERRTITGVNRDVYQVLKDQEVEKYGLDQARERAVKKMNGT